MRILFVGLTCCFLMLCGGVAQAQDTGTVIMCGLLSALTHAPLTANLNCQASAMAKQNVTQPAPSSGGECANLGHYGDIPSGNTYTCFESGHDMVVQGINTNTGSHWHTIIDKDTGIQTGMNAAGQSWRYDPSTGSYNNYATGEHCSGFGANRVCQ